jgi:Ohr subfamily peroxiredoxin
MDVIYTAVATARGGRQGEVVSDDGILDLRLAHPTSLGGPEGEFTNPEQLFAAGYAACFHSALSRLAHLEKIDVSGSSITAEVGLGVDGKLFALVVTLIGSFPTLDRDAAAELMEKAHGVCPYSRGTKGNVEVTLQVA